MKRYDRFHGFHRREKLDLLQDHLDEPPLGMKPHMMGCRHRKRRCRHQSGRTFVLYIYSLVHTFHHNSSKVLACDIPPFRWERPFGPSNFGSEQGYPLGEDEW
jgi:hypothetical protein